MASSRLLRGRNQPQNPTPWAAGGRVPLQLWQGLRSTRPPAPEEVHHDEVTPRLTNPYIAEPARPGRSPHHADPPSAGGRPRPPRRRRYQNPPASLTAARPVPSGAFLGRVGRRHAQKPGNLCDSRAMPSRPSEHPVAKSPGAEHVSAGPGRFHPVPHRPGGGSRGLCRGLSVVIADWVSWWWTVGGYRKRDGPRARRPPGSRRGAFMGWSVRPGRRWGC